MKNSVKTISLQDDRKSTVQIVIDNFQTFPVGNRIKNNCESTMLTSKDIKPKELRKYEW